MDDALRRRRPRVKPRSYSEDIYGASNSSRPLKDKYVLPTVLTLEGVRIPLTSLWAHRKIALVFLRHFGCRFCWYQISQLLPVQKLLAEHEITLVAIGLGTPAQAKQFQLDSKFSGEVYVDDPPFVVKNAVDGAVKPPAERSYAYSSFRLAHGLAFTPEVVAEASRLSSLGFVDKPNYGGIPQTFASDIYQLGGAFVLGPGNQCDFAYRCTSLADHIDVQLLVAAATGLVSPDVPYTLPSTASWLQTLRADAPADAVNSGADAGVGRGRAQSLIEDLPSEGDVLPSSVASTSAKLATSESKAESKLSDFKPSDDHPPMAQVPVQDVDQQTVASPPSGMSKCPFAGLVSVAQYLASPHVMPSSTHGHIKPDMDQRRYLPSWLGLLAVAAVLGVAGWHTGHITLSMPTSLPLDPRFATLVAVLPPLSTMWKPYLIVAVVLVCFTAFTIASCRSTTDSSAPTTADVAAVAVSAPSSLRFYTPSDIDIMIMRAGLADCDCGAVIGSIPMNLALQRKSEAQANAASVTAPLSPASTPPRAEDASDTSSDGRSEDPDSPLSPDSPAPDAENELSAKVLVQFQTTLCYVREFLAKPHPLVGRKGPTCPFVPKSLQLDSIYLTMVDTGARPSVETIEAAALSAAQEFRKLEPRQGRMAMYKAIILIFPQVPLAQAPVLIDGVQHKLKSHFVQQGLMIGEFHLNNNARGLHNPNFYPLRTPFPCLAIRNMVPSDIAFMTGDQYSAATRVAFLESFLRNIGAETSATETKEASLARAALSAARAELNAKQL